MAKREPLVAVAFLVAALSLAGLPPFSGFVAKLTLIHASLDAGEVTAVVVMLLVSLVTLLSMLKIWGGMFWGDPPPTDEEATSAASATRTLTGRRVGLRLAAPAVLLAAVTLCLGLGAELLLSLSQTAAHGLLDPTAYLTAVKGS